MLIGLKLDTEYPNDPDPKKIYHQEFPGIPKFPKPGPTIKNLVM